jgi:ABC-2 type transport system permease protein
MRRIGKIFIGLLIIISSINMTNVSWSSTKVFLTMLVIASQVLFFGGLFIIGSTITFWTVESIEVVNVFTYGGSYMISHPMHIFPRSLRQFFTYIVPAIFLNYYPAIYIFDLVDPFNMPTWTPFLAPFTGVSMFLVALIFWNFGIKRYQSTGT